MGKPRIEFTKVEPVGYQRGTAFVNSKSGGGLDSVATPVYPPHPTGRLVRDLRVTLGVNIRTAAVSFGWSAVELSALECGAHVLADDSEGFKEVCRRLIMASGRSQSVTGD